MTRPGVPPTAVVRAAVPVAVAAVAFAAVVAVLASVAVGFASADTVAGCRAYPRPGSVSAGHVSGPVAAEYGALRRSPRAADAIAVRRLGPLPEADVFTASIRLLGSVPDGGRAYLVPAGHLLALPLIPAHCLPVDQRPREQALLPTLRREYRNRALCLVVVYGHAPGVPTCGAVPGTVAALLHGPGAPGLGLAPDGVPAVSLWFRGRQPPLRARVHGNLWSIARSGGGPTACGLDWVQDSGVVLRSVRSCTPDTT